MARVHAVRLHMRFQRPHELFIVGVRLDGSQRHLRDIILINKWKLMLSCRRNASLEKGSLVCKSVPAKRSIGVLCGKSVEYVVAL